MMAEELNKALAEKLAPLVDERAIYDMGWQCEDGHEITTTYLNEWLTFFPGNGCPEQTVTYGSISPMGPVSIGRCGKPLVSIRLHPKDFFDLTVLFSVLELVAEPGQADKLLVSRNGLNSKWSARMRLNSQSTYAPVGEGDTIPESVAYALLFALEEVAVDV